MIRRVLFLFLAFLAVSNVVNAKIDSVNFVGGTGGSKIIDLEHVNGDILTSGVIYDEDASLVYEITYTNDSPNTKRFVGSDVPNNKQLNYEIVGLDKGMEIKPGDKVSFRYSISSLSNLTKDQMLEINEEASLNLVFETLSVTNPNTGSKSIIVLIVLFTIFSVIFVLFFRSKKMFYASFMLLLLIMIGKKSEIVFADEDASIKVNTNVKYILSNVAPSCANKNYTGDFCIEWKNYGDRNKVNYLVMEDSKEMANTYTIGDVNFELQETYDVSEQQNNDVVLGVYKVVDQESYLFLIGQDGGVVVPKDASYQFTSYDPVNNTNTHDFNYVKYTDFSKFYSNKTTNMSYMLTGIGTLEPMEKLDLSGFETSNVTDMSYMFMGVGEKFKNFNLDLSMFDTSKVENMEGMFLEAGFASETINLDLSSFDTSEVKSMKAMFAYFGHNANEVNLNVDSFNTTNVIDMSDMFLLVNAKKMILSSWNVEKLENASGMFMGASVGELSLNGWNLTNIKNVSSMFRFHTTSSFQTLDLSGVNFVNANDYYRMFYGSTSNPTVIDISDSDWNESAASGDMFKKITGATIYVKDEAAKAYIESRATGCTVLIKNEA